MYIDRGPEYGDGDVRPGDDTDRYLEYWNHVFMTYELREDGSLTELPQRNIDTGLGLERMAMIQQGVDSIFDTDGFTPLIGLAEELSGQEYGSDPKVTRAMRIIADHSRGTVNLIADGVCPRTRTAATCCAGSCGARSSRGAYSGSTRRSSAPSRSG